MSAGDLLMLGASLDPPDSTAASIDDGLRPEPLEVACGLVLNGKPEGPKLGTNVRQPARTAMEASVRPALARPPCLVSFSGGRDSSAVLAIAATLARHEGLPLPIPATYRFPSAPGTHEADWQEAVVSHLRLPDWERITVSDELDVVGPVASRVLRGQGLLSPFNAHFHVPLLERAAGGSLLTGVGGDELFGHQQWWVTRALLTGRRRVRMRHIGTLGLALAPPPVRRQVLARRPEIHWPWLHPEVEEAVNRRRAAWQARAPLRWPAAVEWWWRSRNRAVLSTTLTLLADYAGAQLVQPFLEGSVLESIISFFGVGGPADRSSAMRALFGGLLPEAVLARRSKAFFDQAFFAEHSRSFVAGWSGAGVDTSLVDPHRLAEEWSSESPDPRSFLLLQAAWAAQMSKIADDGGSHGSRQGPRSGGRKPGRPAGS